jgi:hypothetical protein
VFNTYYQQFRMSAWNSSEMGQVAKGFIDSIGPRENVWVVGFPNWVDTRLVANNAGYPGANFEILPDNLASTQNQTGPKLFILNPGDEESQNELKLLYPEGWFQHYKSSTDTKDFVLFIVPSSTDR